MRLLLIIAYFYIMSDFSKYLADNRKRFLDELIDFLRIPSVSNEEVYKSDVRSAANWLEAHLSGIGMENVRIYETDGHPIVYGDWLHAGNNLPTILVYGHYDVQPADPLELWTNPPFEPVIKDNKIFARGSADDKGQIFIHIKSLETHLKNNNKLPLNVKVVFEGEEEIGSGNLYKFLGSNKELLKADYVVISDTSMYKENLPSICYGLRGLCFMQIDVTGPNRDLHSGTFGGGIENPINALSNIISKLKDDKGRILIEGFYDDVVNLTEKERDEFKRLPFDEDSYKKDLAVNELFGEKGFTTVERVSARPTLDCNGIWGGYQGQGAKTVLPSVAGAKVSMRLVPNQDPDKVAELFEKYIIKIAPKTVKVKVTSLHGGKPSVTAIDTPAIGAAVKALESAFGIKPVFFKEGGSIPIVNSFKEVLGADAILLGFGLPDDNIHSPNEKFDLDNFYKGISTVAVFYEEISKIK
jgi:acetylornithine deacetylase/succinyl-diaminopimelate desuccinylase-like protein